MERIAVVTGAGSGIGRATAIALAGAGWRLMLAGRRPAALEETAALVGTDALVHPTDVTDAVAVAALFDAAVARFGRVDLLFNNAGTDVPGVPFEEVTPAIWSAILQTNVTGQFLCAQSAFRAMKAQAPQGGRIINNGSIAAHAPRPNSIPYSMSKHAITGLTKGLMIDGRPYRIAAGQLDIGNAADDPARERPPALQPSGARMVEPFIAHDDVARAVVFMAGLPLEANMPFVTLMATNMPFVGRG